MFNSIETIGACPSCRREQRLEVQFTYGNINGNQYRFGDSLHWGRACHGTKGSKVIVNGIAVCTKCNTDWDVDILVEDNRLQKIEESDPTNRTGAGFKIIEE